MNDSDDALEVAKVLANKLRPVYAFAAITLAMAGGGVSYVWQLAEFINRDAVHEKQQDEHMLEMRDRQGKQDREIAMARNRNLEVVRMMINDLALLRQIQLETLPRKRRDKIRGDFEVQRMNAINLLVTMQQTD